VFLRRPASSSLGNAAMGLLIGADIQRSSHMDNPSKNGCHPLES
jgi:hypothetical protein